MLSGCWAIKGLKEHIQSGVNSTHEQAAEGVVEGPPSVRSSAVTWGWEGGVGVL